MPFFAAHNVTVYFTYGTMHAMKAEGKVIEGVRLVFSNGKQKLDFTLESKQSVTFRYRLLILSGPTTSDQIETQYRSFVNEMK